MRDDATDETSEGEERSVLTARLMLRAPRTEDKANLQLALQNPRIGAALVSAPHPHRAPGVAAWLDEGRIDGTPEPAEAPAATRIAICRRTGLFVGASFHRPSATRPDGFEIAFFVAEPFWGRGFGTEIAHAAVDAAFADASLQRLWCDIRVAHGAARRVVEKCGFQFRDTGMVRSIATRGAVPVERFVLERRIWQSLKAWGTEMRAQQDWAFAGAMAAGVPRDEEDEGEASDAA